MFMERMFRIKVGNKLLKKDAMFLYIFASSHLRLKVLQSCILQLKLIDMTDV